MHGFCCLRRKLGEGNDMGGKQQLGWAVEPECLEMAQLPDGRLHCLGQGGFGAVRHP